MGQDEIDLLYVAGWIRRYGGNLHDHCIILRASEFSARSIIFSGEKLLADAADFVQLQANYDYAKLQPRASN